MERSLIQRLQRLHVLRARGGGATAVRRSMEALAHDLGHALDESSASTFRRRRGWRRRSRSTSNIAIAPHAASEDSSSSMGDTQYSAERQLSSVQVSDSDEMIASAGILSHSRRALRHRLAVVDHPACILPLAESDSLNENNFSPARFQKRNKRKLKRLAMEVGYPPTSVSTSAQGVSASTLRRKRSRIQNTHKENRLLNLVVGKRKCCQREAPSTMLPPSCFSAEDETMDSNSEPNKVHSSDLVSSSSLSSGAESADEPTGGVTNDEGREGDDEQSDWYHDAQDDSADSAVFQLQNKTERELLSGRRRLRDRRPSFSVVSVLNERVARFVQDPSVSELCLSILGTVEEIQLDHLARLYSLRVHQQSTTSYSLIKTSMTTQAVRVCASTFSGSDLTSKRRRRGLPESPLTTGVESQSFCVPHRPSCSRTPRSAAARSPPAAQSQLITSDAPPNLFN